MCLALSNTTVSSIEAIQWEALRCIGVTSEYAKKEVSSREAASSKRDTLLRLSDEEKSKQRSHRLEGGEPLRVQNHVVACASTTPHTFHAPSQHRLHARLYRHGTHRHTSLHLAHRPTHHEAHRALRLTRHHIQRSALRHGTCTFRHTRRHAVRQH